MNSKNNKNNVVLMKIEKVQNTDIDLIMKNQSVFKAQN